MLELSCFLNSEFKLLTRQSLWEQLSLFYCADEGSLAEQLFQLTADDQKSAQQATQWIKKLRSDQQGSSLVNELLTRFNLASEEGAILLSLAEALLRIPDEPTAKSLISDKLDSLDLEQLVTETNTSENGSLINGSLWGLLISQKLFNSPDADKEQDNFRSLWQRLGEKGTLHALKFAMSRLGEQFVFSEEISTAIQQRNDYDSATTAFSFDMLGEAALCQRDVEFYFQAYMDAIRTVGESNGYDSSISIKLSALHPRLENRQREQVLKKLTHRMLQLLVVARSLDVAVTIDAEEAELTELTTLLFAQLLQTDLCKGWGKLGLAVQAYSKRALPLLGWLEKLAQEVETEIPVRLVKGAYWDSEIKKAQQRGLDHYPVYTNKALTDLSYQLCARFLLSAQCRLLQPQFASHNAMTLAFIQQLTTDKNYELQRLHGMGEQLYQQLCQQSGRVCRIYAPVGSYQQLLPYLVRRLLENGANSSFVFNLNSPDVEIEKLTTPAKALYLDSSETSKKLALPADLYQPYRKNSAGVNLGSIETLNQWQEVIEHFAEQQWRCQPIIAGEVCEGSELKALHAPYDHEKLIGYRSFATQRQIKQMIESCQNHLPQWRRSDIQTRQQLLYNYARLLEEHAAELITLCMLEAGKVLEDAIDELREAIDFCYYYAQQIEDNLQPISLPGVTGEENQLQYLGRGIYLAISPWNFPLAIFTGQIAAALATGNCVIAKPSCATSLIAFRAVELWFEAGLPTECLHLCPYPKGDLSSAILKDTRLSGVCFTGSTAAAAEINHTLATRVGAPIANLIAETGGINAMIVDSSALTEQVVKDVIRSAFNSAGQRCSALRVLYLQRDIAAETEEKLIGAMQELVIGSPELINTDIGPIINQQAMSELHQHIERLRLKERVLFECPLSEKHNPGYFVPPTLIRLHTLDELSEEVFGPVLHIIHFDAEDLCRIGHEVNRSGYGLTLGIHSRNQHFIDQICQRADVGNIYINRDQVGAVVASQPFGGMGLSGTGPKSGGPNYLRQFVREQTITTNTTASGGDRKLLAGL